jgi:hypothetical protein
VPPGRAISIASSPDLGDVGRATHCSDRLRRAEPECPRSPLVVRVQNYRVATGCANECANHQPERSAPEDDGGVPRLYLSALDRVNGARQRFGHGGDIERQTQRKPMEVLRCDPGRNQNLVRKSTEQIEEILAEAVPPARALKAFVTGGRICAEDAIANSPARDAGSKRLHLARKLVTKPRRITADGGVPLPIGLHVGPTREGSPNPQHDLPGSGLVAGNVLDAQVARRVQKRSPHQPSTMTLIASFERAVSSAEAMADRGKRWVMMPSPVTLPEASKSKASRVSIGPAE